jgi:nucleoside 2-deoxyribosyltransferase
VTASGTRPRCYVASPLGFNEAGLSYYREHYLPALGAVVEPIDPWELVDPAALAAAREAGSMRQLWLSVGQRNLELIRGSRLLAAWLDGQEVDSGTATEVGFATGTGVRCYGLRSDLRRAGEEGMSVNLQVEATIVASGGAIVPSLEQLVAALREAAADLD